MRAWLAADDEPQGSQPSHGWRPHRGGQTAGGDITTPGRGVKGWIAGDITPGVDRLHQAVRRSSWGETLDANRGVRRLSNRLKAGSLDAWT